MSSTTTATFKIWRGNAEGGQFREYQARIDEGMVVLDAVHQIQAEQAPDMAVRWNCKAGKCGSCSSEINGMPKLMCMTRLSDLPMDKPITVMLNALLRQAGVADTRTEQSDHPEARSLFFPADRDQGQAVIGRINRLRIGPVPASDLEVERTRYDRIENPIADELRYQQVKAQRFHLEAQASSLLQVRSTDRALS